jgi:hypothetical protein
VLLRDARNQPLRIIAQCREHAFYASPDALWGELLQIKGNVWTPDTCECATYYWWDARLADTQRVEHPLEHEQHTQRCALHTKHWHAARHRDVLLTENRQKNYAVNAASECTGWRPSPLGGDDAAYRTLVVHGLIEGVPVTALPPQEIPYRFTVTRAVIVALDRIGVAETDFRRTLAIAQRGSGMRTGRVRAA